MDHIINQIISTIQDKQGGSKRLIKIDQLEQEIIHTLGSHSRYAELGGYKKIHEVVLSLKEQGILQELVKPFTNWKKKPSLHESYWVLPKYKNNAWNKGDIAKAMTYLDLGFYLRNKKYQTTEEWEKVKRVYYFLKNKEAYSEITREERSLMLFNQLQLPDNMEPEKFLSSPAGQQLLNRLSLSPKDLMCKVVREPFHYWRNEQSPSQYANEILVIEGLSTYLTVKDILENHFTLWKFGPVPAYLIWGEGYRICNTLEYLEVLRDDPRELRITYAGDIDYEGFNIYLEMKNRYRNLNISLAYPFYSFLLSYTDKFASEIHKKQRVVEKNLLLLQEEFQGYEQIFEEIKQLWNTRKRIAQECFNPDTILSGGDSV
jgi:hypothetical protein